MRSIKSIETIEASDQYVSICVVELLDGVHGGGETKNDYNIYSWVLLIMVELNQK